MKEIEWNKTHFINDFQRKQYESAKLAAERLKQNPLTVEQLRAQSKRLTELVEEAKKKERAERKAKKELSKKY